MTTILTKMFPSYNGTANQLTGIYNHGKLALNKFHLAIMLNNDTGIFYIYSFWLKTQLIINLFIDMVYLSWLQ